jgi:transposase
METMYYIGLDVHKKTIDYCVKDASGCVCAEGSLPATRFDLDRRMRTHHSSGPQRRKPRLLRR